MKYLRNNKGTIFDYSDRLAEQAGFVILTEEEAFPERFVPSNLPKRKSKVAITVPEELLVEPDNTPPELAAQKGKTFAPDVGPEPKKTKSVLNKLGLKGKK